MCSTRWLHSSGQRRCGRFLSKIKVRQEVAELMSNTMDGDEFERRLWVRIDAAYVTAHSDDAQLPSIFCH